MVDRDLQRKVLSFLNKVYPYSKQKRHIASKIGNFREFNYNFEYLFENKLISRSRMHQTHAWEYKITADGLDYLNRPCWFVRIFKKAVEKSIINGIGFILGMIAMFMLTKILSALR